MATPEPEVVIRAMVHSDWPEVRSIYAAGIATGNATFETDPPEWEVWDQSHLSELRVVAVDGAQVIGWAAASPVSDRCCYSGVVENSVYVEPDHQGQGLGKRLLEALVSASEAAGNWTIQTGIFPENTASLALHQACGFRVVGRRERLGQLAGRWRDVMLLERRSDYPCAQHAITHAPRVDAGIEGSRSTSARLLRHAKAWCSLRRLPQYAAGLGYQRADPRSLNGSLTERTKEYGADP